jgi:hypothetical protein
MTDFRALCAEIVQLENEQQPDYADWKRRWNAVISRARAALAQPEPEGDVTDEELHAFWDTGFEGDFQDCRRFFRKAVEHFAFRRRAPQVADGEVMELVNSLRHSGDALRAYGLHGGADDCTRAADILSQLAPVPPAEGEVAELVAWLRQNAEDERQMCESANRASLNLDRCAALLQQGHSAAPAGLHRLQQENARFREPERTILCDLLANGTLLPDPDGKRYGVQPVDGEVGALAKQMELWLCRLDLEPTKRITPQKYNPILPLSVSTSPPAASTAGRPSPCR